MGKEKRKWYQTGEFEDGYQFGDIFRTLKNAVSTKNDNKINKDNDTKNTDEESNSKLYSVDNIWRLPEPDVIAQRIKNENFKDSKTYRKDFPKQFIVNDRINSAATNSSIIESKNIKPDSIQSNVKKEIINRMENTDVKEIQDIITALNVNEWKNADTMNKYSAKISIYVDDWIALENMGYFDHMTVEERNNAVESLKIIKDAVNSKKELFSKYRDKNEFNHYNWNNKYGTMTWEELETVERQIKDDLLGKNGKNNTTLQEFQYVKSLRNGFQNADAYNRYIEAINMPFDELTKEYLDTRRVLKKYNDIENSRRASYIEQYKELAPILRSEGYSEEEIDQKITDDTVGYYKMLKDAENNLKIEEKYGGVDALKSKYALLEELYYRSYSNQKTADMILNAFNDKQYLFFVEQGKEKLKKNKYMTDTEYNVACYYMAKGGSNSKKYLEEIEDELQRRETNDRQQKFASFAEKLPVTASIASIPLNVISAGEQIVDIGKYMITGDVDYNTNALGVSAIRGTVANKIDDPIGSFAYDTTMSGLDSIAAMGLSNLITGTNDLGGIILGLSAAGNATNDAISRGMSDEYAFANGIAAAVFESLFENWSIGKFSEGLNNLNLRDIKNLSAFFAKNIYNNALEENLTEIANISYDVLVNREYSQYEKAINDYMISGLSETDAKRKVALELAEQVAQATASGALMGFGFSNIGVADSTGINQISKNIEKSINKLQLETTNAVTNSIESYPIEKQDLIKGFLNSVDRGLKSFVESVKNNGDKFEWYNISNVNEREAEDIKDLIGIDVRGYTHNINSDSIKHILKRHGENGQQDSTMANIDDIARVGWVIENYDTVEIITKNGQRVYSSLFTDKNNNPALHIRYSKKINGTYYVVEAVFENRYNKLWVQSTYLSNKKEVVTQAPDAADRLPMVTSKTPPASPTSKISLSQDKGNVNNTEISKEVTSQSGVASFSFKDGSIKAVPKITEEDGIRTIDTIKSMNEDAFIDGLWGRNERQNSEVAENVEISQLESVENIDESGIIEEKVDTDTGVPGEYKYTIKWQNRNIPARETGEGHRGPRTKQHNERVNNYELKINPDNESFFLEHPDGKMVQFENMRNGIVQDGKLVMDKNSIYYVKEKIPVLNIKILNQAKRQLEAANRAGYKVEWLVSEQKAVVQMRQLFNENNLDIIVTYYPE